jgi:hypothetical protein
MGERLISGKKIMVTKKFDIVSIEIHCGDEYEAAVLFDDVLNRIRSGEGVFIGNSSPMEKWPEVG